MSLVETLRRWLGLAERSSVESDLPTCIDLPALSETWVVDYQRTASRTVVARIQAAGHIRVSGGVSDREQVLAALRRWLVRHARVQLEPRLAALALQTGWHYGALSVRNQRTRWGSCSSSGRISLNCRLLFLSPPLVRMVMLHELCHRVEPNHSMRFWARLRQIEPNTERLHAQLRHAGTAVPRWVHPPERRYRVIR